MPNKPRQDDPRSVRHFVAATVGGRVQYVYTVPNDAGMIAVKLSSSILFAEAFHEAELTHIAMIMYAAHNATARSQICDSRTILPRHMRKTINAL